MTKDDLLQLILVAADDVGRDFDHAETARWPAGAADDFAELGLLRRSTGGMSVTCPNCIDEHIEPVTVRTDANGRERFFIWCPESMRVEVQPEMCCSFEVDSIGIASAIASSMSLKGAPKRVVPDRLWRLGRMPWKDSTRQVVLARRLADPDSHHVARHVGHGGRDIVLVPHHIPDDRLWIGRVPSVIALSQITTVVDATLMLDAEALLECIADADHAATERLEVPLDTVAAKKVKHHVKATIESMISNEALVQAYRVHGSYRKTADALNEEGFVTDRWSVERAVKAAGGPKAVKASKDSASVARTVASQPRDRGKKIDMYRK